MRIPPIHIRHHLRPTAPGRTPREDRPEKPDHAAWSIALAVGLAVGAAIYLGPIGPARDAARGVEPTPALPIVTVPYSDARRDTWCPTPEQRAAADGVIPPPARLATGPAVEGDEPPLDPSALEPVPGLVERLETMVELLGPPQPIGAGAGSCVPAELVRRDLAILIDDLKAGRVTRP